MKMDVLDYIISCIHENKLPHAFLIETTCFDELKEKILNIFLKNNIILTNNPENNKDILNIMPENNLIDKDKILRIQDSFSLTSYDDSYKIYFINYAECMNDSSSNKLLKFLEEPNEKIIGFLFTTDINQILSTIKSRCEIFYYHEVNESNPEIDIEAQNIYEMINNNIYDIIIYMRKFKSLDRRIFSLILIRLIELIKNNTSINYYQKKSMIKVLKDSLKYIEQYVNIDLIIDNIALELGK